MMQHSELPLRGCAAERSVEELQSLLRRQSGMGKHGARPASDASTGVEGHISQDQSAVNEFERMKRPGKPPPFRK
jgi:hypothetical protein